MTKEPKNIEDKVTKAGAVELDEAKLDDVAGGDIVNETISLNFSKIEYEAIKPNSLKITDGTSNTIQKR